MCVCVYDNWHPTSCSNFSCFFVISSLHSDTHKSCVHRCDLYVYMSCVCELCISLPAFPVLKFCLQLSLYVIYVQMFHPHLATANTWLIYWLVISYWGHSFSFKFKHDIIVNLLWELTDGYLMPSSSLIWGYKEEMTICFIKANLYENSENMYTVLLNKAVECERTL